MSRSVTILHISDLHRDPHNPIRNDALLLSLDNDCRRYTGGADEHAVRPPDIIVVSGDVIQGVSPGSPDYADKLSAQHDEALSFLGQLADRFLSGNRQRVVLVPGNHDVSACHFMECLQRVDVAADRKKDLVSQLFMQGSPLRWSWPEFGLYQIVDASQYAKRLAPFAAFYSTFYEGTRTFNLDPSRQFDVFDYPEFDLTIVGLSSCHNNDILNKQGAIHPGCIGEVGNQLRDSHFNGRLRVAVWHHNTEGEPMRTDYMSAGILQNLIDSGFSIGMHGHQHRPQFLDTRFRFGSDARITVLSAGTLCGSASYRYGRAYNIVELETERRTGRLHVREMQNDDLNLPIWGRRRLSPDTAPFLNFTYDAPPTPVVTPMASTTGLLEAQRLIASGDWAGAAALLRGVASTEALARPLLLDCLGHLNDMASIAALFDPPTSSIEALYVMEALWREGSRDRLRALLAEPIVADSKDRSVVDERRKYTARLQR